MHEVFYIKQPNNEGSEIELSDNQSPWKVLGESSIWWTS